MTRLATVLSLVALVGCGGGESADVDAGGELDAGPGSDASSGEDAGRDGGTDASAIDDAGSIDAGADASADAAPQDAGPPCEFTSTLDRSCSADGDCAVGIHQTDCCGNTYAIGMSASERARFDALEPLCEATYPICGCPVGPTRTDSGEMAGDPTSIQVACVGVGPTNACRTYVTMRPPDGV